MRRIYREIEHLGEFLLFFGREAVGAIMPRDIVTGFLAAWAIGAFGLMLYAFNLAVPV